MRIALLLALLLFGGLLWFTRAGGSVSLERAPGPSLLPRESPENSAIPDLRRPGERAPATTPGGGATSPLPHDSWPDLDPAWRERREWLLYGRVLRDDAPFPDCRLRIDGEGADDVLMSTDALGRFRLAGLPLAGKWEIEVLSVSPTATVDVRSNPGRTPWEIVVHVGTASVSGRVFDTAGLPVAAQPIAAQVLLEQGGGPRLETRTDTTGSYRLEGLSAGRILVRGGSVPPNSRDVKLTAGAIVRGVDLGPSPDFPEVSVTLRLPDGRPLVPPAGSLHLLGGPGATTTLAPVPGECWRGRVPPGEYQPVSRLPLVEERLVLDTGSTAIALNVRGAVVRVRAAAEREAARPYRLVLLVHGESGAILDQDTALAGRDVWFGGLAPGRYVIRSSEGDDASGVEVVVAGPREVIEVDEPLP